MVIQFSIYEVTYERVTTLCILISHSRCGETVTKLDQHLICQLFHLPFT